MMRCAAVGIVVGAVALAGCGGGNDRTTAVRGTAPTTRTAPVQRAPRAHEPARKRVTVTVPHGWAVPPRRVSHAGWPRPVHVAASFPVRHMPANTSCPYSVLSHMPADGVLMFVAEYTKPRPRGIPPGLPLGPRPDLRHLQIRDEEVECWDGPGGYADFKEHGRAFRVEVLFGRKATAAARRRALDALATLKIG